MRSAGASLDRTPARLHTTVRLKLNQNSMSLTANLATISNRDAWHVVFSFFCRDSLAALAAEPASSTRQISAPRGMRPSGLPSHLVHFILLHQHNKTMMKAQREPRGLNALSRARPHCLDEARHGANSLQSSPPETTPRLTMAPSRLAPKIDDQALGSRIR